MALLIYMVGVFALLPEYQVSADMRIAEYESDPDSDWVDQLDELISEKMSVKFSEIYELLRTGDIDGACRRVGRALADSIAYEVRTSRVLALQIIAVIVLGSTLPRCRAISESM